MLKLAITGEAVRREELKKNLTGDYKFLEAEIPTTLKPENPLPVFILNDLHSDEILSAAKKLQPSLLIVSVLKNSLSGIFGDLGMNIPVIGINTLPGFLEKPIWECSSLQIEHRGEFEKLADTLGKQIKWVKDKVGLVSPRVISMIINEACFTLEEGTASRDDIDLAMKLGTNYPYGPFEWADRLGLEKINGVLEALYMDTGDERYKICPLLKTMHRENKSFYN